MSKDLSSVVRAYATCIKLRSHAFVDGICSRCGAKEDGPSLAEVLAERNKR